MANLEGERTGVGLTPRLVKKISNPTVEDHFRESVILKGYVPLSLNIIRTWVHNLGDQKFKHSIANVRSCKFKADWNVTIFQAEGGSADISKLGALK